MSQSVLVRRRLVSSVAANLIRQPVVRALGIVGSVIAARVLGPESLAIVAAITVTSTTILTFLDFGITPSISRIMPELAVRFGRAEAIQTRRQLMQIKLLLVSLGLVGFIFLQAIGIWKVRQDIARSVWFFVFVGANTWLSAVADIKREEWVAALRMSSLAALQIVVAIISPLVVIVSVAVWRDPYLVSAAYLTPVVLELVALTLRSYDLDSDSRNTSSVRGLGPRRILSMFGRYCGVTYLINLCNRFVFGLPLAFMILSALGVELGILGNLAVSFAIISFGWDIASTPLTSLRVPILARLYAENDPVRFLRAQRLMTSMMILTSGLMAVAMLTLIPAILNLVYGSRYESAIDWGTRIAVAALVFGFFSLGNSTIRQVGRYGSVIVGLFLALGFVAASIILGAKLLSNTLWSPLVLASCVVGRAIFWITTDLWTDAVVFYWQGVGIKIRGLVAVGLALAITFGIVRWAHLPSLSANLLAFVVGTMVFLLSFRLMGGAGPDVRQSVSGILGARGRWAVRFL